MPPDPAIRDHKSWIGYLRPEGLVVSPAALVDAQVAIDRGQATARQAEFLAFVNEVPHGDGKVPAVTDLKRLLAEFLGWPGDLLDGASDDQPIPDALKIPLRDFGETLEPTFALRHPRPDDPQHPWLLLVDERPPESDLDQPVESHLAGWSASPTRRFERLLREAGVPIGLLSNGRQLLLVYAPRGENAGTLTFPVAAMSEIAGRPILAAFDMLLSRYRLLAAPSEARLPALLKRSRDYQSRVSTALAEQVLDALYELLRGFQAADDYAHGELLKAVLADDPDQVYRIGNRESGVGNRGALPTPNSPLPIPCFHWEIEFPEVFARQARGFDAIVGNPPFAGKNTLIAGHREGYLDWLKAMHDESHGNADLVAHFFRRAFNLLKPDGCFGLIATNTIGQGDTRSTGLRWICTHGGTIYAARKRYKWPGLAAVVVSVVHVSKGQLSPPYLLDGRQVPIITAYLFHAGGHGDPMALADNGDRSFIGYYVMGMGFTFDDTDPDGEASSIAELEAICRADPASRERVFPYLGGEEIVTEPNQAYHRFIINFGTMTLREAERWPSLVDVVRRRVKPLRDRQNRDANRERWWQYAETRPGLTEALNRASRVILLSRVAQHLAFVYSTPEIIFSEQLVVFVTATDQFFAVIQSRPHDIWARFFSSSLEERLRYTPSDCFETFPLPSDMDINASLAEVSREYYEFRAALMVRNNEGLTKTYNRFHDPGEASADIVRLHELHDALDRAVLEAYGWTDIRPECQFLLDYDDQDEADDEPPARARTRQRRKPWRYRWPDDIRDEVLARLLKLNSDRAAAERRTGAAAASKKGPAARTKTSRSASSKKASRSKNLPEMGP